MGRQLPVERHCFTLYDFAVYPVPLGPPQLRRQPVGMEFDSHIQILYLPRARHAELALSGVGRITRILIADPELQRQRLAYIERASKQDLGDEHAVADLPDVSCQLLAALAKLKSLHLAVANERDAVNALRGCLDDLHSASTVDAPVRADVDMIVQRQCPMPSRPEHAVYVLLRS